MNDPDSSQTGFKSRLTDSQTGSEQSGTNTGNGQPRIPPRVPLKPSTIGMKPRERQHPLDLSGITISKPVLLPKPANPYQLANRKQEEVGNLSDSKPKSSSQSSGSDLNTTRDSEDSVFTSTSDLDKAKPLSEIRRKFPSVFTSESQFPVKLVDVTARECGLSDSSDDFWNTKVQRILIFDSRPIF